jgi:hypothetical protein
MSVRRLRKEASEFVGHLVRIFFQYFHVLPASGVGKPSEAGNGHSTASSQASHVSELRAMVVSFRESSTSIVEPERYGMSLHTDAQGQRPADRELPEKESS